MKNLINFFKQFRLTQILTVVLAGMLLITNVACSASDSRNAAKDNLPVQVGGNNNPYKGGGSASTASRMSDPHLNVENKRSALPDGTLIATQVKTDADDLLYPGSGTKSSPDSSIGTRDQDQLSREVNKFPKQPQPVVDRSNPDTKILEKVGENFKESSKFLKDIADEASRRPEMRANPAVGE